VERQAKTTRRASMTRGKPHRGQSVQEKRPKPGADLQTKRGGNWNRGEEGGITFRPLSSKKVRGSKEGKNRAGGRGKNGGITGEGNVKTHQNGNTNEKHLKWM